MTRIRLTGRRRLPLALIATTLVALLAAATAGAHAELSPAVGLANKSALYSLAVPTEKEGAKTTRIVLTVPAGFSIDSFVAAPGWTRELQQKGSGENAVIQKVTWTASAAAGVPTGEDALFQFLGLPGSAGTFTFGVEQSYSDGSVVDWSGPESSDTPAPSIEARTAIGGGGGTSTLAIVALAVGAVGVLIGAVAVGGGRGKRDLA